MIGGSPWWRPRPGRRGWAGVLAIGVAMLACTPERVASAAAAATPSGADPAPIREVSPTYFGMHMHGIHRGVAWPSVPMGAWRMWDAHVTWRDVQPTEDRWAFDALDHDVETARRHGAEVLLPLGLSPRWASARPDEPSAYGAGHAAPPRTLALWERYVETVARRYRGRVAAYEIWNEPNAERFFSGSVEEIVRLTCAARAILRRVDPAARLVSPSATHGAKGVAWLDTFLAAGGGRCIDIVGFHFYTLAHEPPEALVPLARGVHGVLNRHGLTGLPVWNTESGWYLRNATRPLTVRWRSLDDDTAVAYVGRALLLAPALGIERFYWYAWDDGNLGLFELEFARPKPAARAYSGVARWITGASSYHCDLSRAPLVACRFQRGGRQHHVLWSRSAAEPFTPPDDWRIERVEVLGQPARAWQAGATLTIGDTPVLLESTP